jgi:hypothetical protein
VRLFWRRRRRIARPPPFRHGTALIWRYSAHQPQHRLPTQARPLSLQLVSISSGITTIFLDANEDLYVGPNAVVSSTGSEFEAIVGTGADVDVTVAGTVISGGIGIFARGPLLSIRVRVD